MPPHLPPLLGCGWQVTKEGGRVTCPGWPLGEGGTRVDRARGEEGLGTQGLRSPWPVGSSSLGSLGHQQ